jgi:outer membrane lipoprotein SlyB
MVSLMENDGSDQKKSSQAIDTAMGASAGAAVGSVIGAAVTGAVLGPIFPVLALSVLGAAVGSIVGRSFDNDDEDKEDTPSQK